MRKPWSAADLVLGGATLLATLCAGANAQTPADSGCEEYIKTPLPAEALTVPAPKTWPDCDSIRSCSGIGRKVDFEAVRKCAWSERLERQADLEPRYTVASPFGGSALLAVLHANGEGVEQDKALAAWNYNLLT